MRRDDTKLSPLASPILFTHKLGPSMSLLCGCVVVCFLCGLFFVCVCFLFLCGSCLLLFCVSFFVWFSERDKGIGLCIGPLPVYFCGPTARPLRELIN